MTPHPQRCETCITKECDYHPGNSVFPIAVMSIRVFIDKYGCASHTPAKSEQEIRNELLEDISGFIAGWGSLNHQIPKKALKKKIEELRNGGCPDKLTESVCDTNVCGDVCPHYLTSKQEIRKDEREKVLEGRKIYRCKSDTCSDNGGVCILCIPDMDFEVPTSCVNPEAFTNNGDEPDCEWVELRSKQGEQR